jgi:membrane protein DedA with SNARE-associated domain
MTDWVTSVIDALGYVGVAILVALESVFPPIPSEVVLPLAGFHAGRGGASLPGMIAAATIGSVVGAWVLYGVAVGIGPERLRRFVLRYGRWFRLTADDLDRAEGWFDSRAETAVLVGRCAPLIRSIISVPAGFRHMPLGRFTLYTALGSLAWNIALISAGAVLGDRWHEVGDVVGLLQAVIILVVAAGAGLFLWRRVVRPRLARDAEAVRQD